MWSLARQKNIPSAERQKHVNELMKVIRGKVKEIVFKHDASRIVQTVVKYGRQKERDEIALELKGKYEDLAQNKYSKVSIYLSPQNICLHPAVVPHLETHPAMPNTPRRDSSRIPIPRPPAAPSSRSVFRPRRRFRAPCERLRTHIAITRFLWQGGPPF